MRYLCSITTAPGANAPGDTTGYLEADEVPAVGTQVTITVEAENGEVQQVRGELYSILEEGDLWW